MLINPQFLFKDEVYSNRWHQVQWTPEAPHLYMVCFCQVPRVSAGQYNTPLDIKIKRADVKLERKVFRSNSSREKFYKFFLGQCQECKTVYWSCENFDWVQLASDADQIEMFLSVLQFRHVTYDVPPVKRSHRYVVPHTHIITVENGDYKETRKVQ